ncbi:MAG TPA: rod shape-determining protein MreC [Vicinamibacterales bacterium]|jgi:rod shape-determining protein MreC|nr:rod shape-determining protein MreC [Vicinamibacterales bacterium]
MALADIKQRPGTVLGVAVVLHLVLISVQVNTATGIPIFRALTFGTFSEVQRMITGAVTGVEELWSGYFALRGVNDENAALRQQLQDLQIKLQEERALAQRTEDLRQLLELRQRAELETTAAEIIAAGASPEFRTVTIDKGTGDRVDADMAVLSPSGVVGRVILPSARASKVQLLIDRNAAAGAIIERSRAQGVVVGAGGETLRMDYVPGTADVKAGDLVVTSGIDGIYPKGFVIGTVETVERGPGSYHEIRVSPAVDFSRLEEVLVVLTPPPGHDTAPAKGERP